MAKVSKRLKALRSSVELTNCTQSMKQLLWLKKLLLLNSTSLLTYLSTWVLILVNLTKLFVVQSFCLKVPVKQLA